MQPSNGSPRIAIVELPIVADCKIDMAILVDIARCEADVILLGVGRGMNDMRLPGRILKPYVAFAVTDRNVELPITIDIDRQNGIADP